ncbi:MAG: hypothetical protein M3680_32585, partial [Myxococcota bacterium]|nr:hypothetical protein [Myxococcota bacterium]
MPSEYATPRDYVDDVVELVERVLEAARRASAVVTDEDHRAIAELELDIARRDELIAARCEVTAQVHGRMPLDEARRVFGLSATEARVLAVLAALELSPRAREAAAKLLPEVTSSATIGLVEVLVYRTRAARGAAAEELAEDGRLFRHRLAELGSADLPLLARPVRVARRVLELALGRVRLDVDVARIATLVATPSGGEHLLVEPDRRALVFDAVRRQSETMYAAIPWIVGPPGSGRVSLALAAAHHAGKQALIVRAQALPRAPDELVRALQAALREALLFDAALVIRDLDVLAGDAERSIVDLIPHAAAVLANHTGPVIVTAARALWPAGNDRPFVVAEIGVPDEGDRVTLWQRTLGPADAALAEDAASRYQITGGIIERAAASARSRAAGRGTPLELADLRAGVRAQLEPDLV